MDKKELQYIKELLEKFYNGVASIEEEQKLTEFFKTSEELPEDLEGDRKMFMALYDPSAMPEMPEGLEENIMQNIRRVEGKRRWKIAGWIIGVAAVVAVIIMFPFGFETRVEENRGLAVENHTKMADDSVVNPENMNAPGQLIEEREEVAQDGTPEKMIAKTSRIEKSVEKQAEAKSDTSESIEISDEQLEGIEKGLAALARTGKLLAFADKSVTEADSRFSEACDRASEILNNIK